MAKRNKILVYFQILIVICLMLCNCAITSKSIRKSSVLNYKESQCCCKLESDCNNCGCVPGGNKGSFRENSKEPNSFHTFIGSINCKLGNDPLTNINFVVKYLSEEQIQPAKETFLCFLTRDFTIFHPKEIINLPEKPPRFLS